MTTTKQDTAPKCRQCGKALRKYRWRDCSWAHGRLWGDFGDGQFCGKQCGYRFGLAAVQALDGGRCALGDFALLSQRKEGGAS